MNFKRSFLLVGFFLLFSAGFAQTELDGRINTITTAVPFLRISPDARSGAMGDVGVAISPDANSMHWNPSKYAFIEKDMGFGASFTPWLRALNIGDIYLAYLSGFKRIDDQQVLAASLRYFSLGNISFTDIVGQPLGDFRPNEFAIDGAYSRRLSDNFSFGTVLRFIYSNLATGFQSGGNAIRPGTAVAADISAFYNKDIRLSDKKANIAYGVNISNIGSKVSYSKETDNKDFIPINLALGTALEIEIDDYNDLTFAFDLNKLLTPTPDTIGNAYRDKSVISGMFGSFSDAPGGFSEEMRELMFSIGAEYWYDKQFAIRGGYFNEHATKGNRKYFTTGIGLKYNVFTIYMAYLIPGGGFLSKKGSTAQKNPLDNTLRFTLLFDFDALKGTTPAPDEE